MSWKAERYFAKAQEYWSRATKRERNSDEFLLNVAFFCEFIVRGALCGVNPILNAAKEEESILFAVGVNPNRPPKTIEFSAALSRVCRLVPLITENERTTVNDLIINRNEELHGDLGEIAKIPSNETMPRVYSFISKVFEFSTQDLDVIMGKSDANNVRLNAQASLTDRKKRIGDLIRKHKQKFFKLKKATQEKRRKSSEPIFAYIIKTSGHHIKPHKCRSCASTGILVGAPVGRSAPILREDGIFEEVRISPQIFECKCCGLKIKGLDELMAAGFEHEFQTVNEMDIVDHFNIDPMDYVDTEEIIREYGEDMEASSY